jgi:hypothetical protein
MLPLANAAMRAGHGTFAERGLRTWAVGPTFAEAWDARNAALPDLDSSALFGVSAANPAINLVPQANEWRPDIVINEISEFAGPIAAA